MRAVRKGYTVCEIIKILQQEPMLSEPNQNGNVTPMQHCPSFEERHSETLALPSCWFCRHADFHLTARRALDVGICHWPKKVVK